MSDPIRSISQNNFLLAAQQEVSHDNTLSGNGTEESPLSVVNDTVSHDSTLTGSGTSEDPLKVAKPLDETVLYNNPSGTTSSITLSESIYNFEIVEIYTATRTSTNTVGPSVYRFSLINNPNLFSAAAGSVYNTYPNNVAIKFTVSSTSISTSTSNTGTSALTYKVVGIKRR